MLQNARFTPFIFSESLRENQLEGGWGVKNPYSLRLGLPSVDSK